MGGLASRPYQGFRGAWMMRAWLDDIQFGFRSLLFHRGQTFWTVLLLALGIGGATAVFTVANAVLIRPLPYPNPDALVEIGESNPRLGIRAMPISLPDFLDIGKQNHVFSSVNAYRPGAVNIRLAGQMTRTASAHITAALLQEFGTRPFMGRLFLPDDKVGDRLVLVGHRFWSGRLGRDKAAVGKALQVGDDRYTIIGVLPEDFFFPSETDLLFLMDVVPNPFTPRSSRLNHVVARLKSGVADSEVRSDLERIYSRLGADFPQTNAGWQMDVVPLHRAIAGDTRLPLLLLIGAAVCLLLATGANVAGMLLVSALRQRREVALGSALGATPARILCQLMLRGLLLALIAGVLGFVLAVWSKAFLLSLIPTHIPLLGHVSFDWRVVSFAFVVTLAVGGIAGLSPALFSRDLSISRTLREGGSVSSLSLSTLRMRTVFVVAQIAIGLTLVTAMTLLGGHLYDLLHKDMGYDPANVVLIQTEFSFMKRGQGSRAYHEIVEELRRVPGVDSATVTSCFPVGDATAKQENHCTFQVAGRPPVPPPGLDAVFEDIDPDYFHALRIPLLSGRHFRASDLQKEDDSVWQVIINDAMARRHWPGESAVGKRFTATLWDSWKVPSEVIGVCADVHSAGYVLNPSPTIYYPNGFFGSGWIIVRAKSNPNGLFETLRKTILSTSWRDDITVIRISTLDTALDRSVASPRLVSLIVLFFAGMSFLLALLGTYSVMAYSAALRTRELAIRQAMGATPRQIFTSVLLEGCRIASAGGAIGLLLSFCVYHIARNQIAEMGCSHPAGVILLSGLACVSCVLISVKPALDAAAIPASLALRED